jgi:hypothetical protein
MALATITPSSGNLLVLPMCFGGFHAAQLPQKGDTRPTQCPGACHATWCRSRTRLNIDDGDQET